LKDLETKSQDPDLWNDQQKAQKILKEKTSVESKLNKFEKLVGKSEDSILLLDMSLEEGDNTSISEAEQEIINLEQEISSFEIECLLSGDADSNNAFLEINSGAGGTESCDWAEMLQRMYLRWAEKNDYKIEIVSQLEGEEAGIKSCVIKISGENAYGWLKAESGVHRLVRISPFDSNARRHTSFASVWVYPEIDDDIEIEIDEKDIRVDTYRASGAGGQHVNKTDSAIRITHIPTNIVAQSQNSRSQHSNRAEAMKMLKARLYELELRKREEEKQQENSKKTDNSWGNQIRSYVLHPYQMVKDLRTNHETSDTTGVLDGNIQPFINAYLSTARN
jgi:peptide chain release factor 2